jgi:hypothetical protein
MAFGIWANIEISMVILPLKEEAKQKGDLAQTEGWLEPI